MVAVPNYSERAALPLDDMMKTLNERLRTVGLNFDDMPKATDPVTEEQRRAGAVANELFSSDRGLWLLEFLADQTVRRPKALPPLGTDPVQAYLHVQRLAGMDDIFFYLLRLIAIGREEQPQHREGAQL